MNKRVGKVIKNMNINKELE